MAETETITDDFSGVLTGDKGCYRDNKLRHRRIHYNICQCHRSWGECRLSMGRFYSGGIADFRKSATRVAGEASFSDKTKVEQDT